MHRRFVCRDCGTKWFTYEQWMAESELTGCGRCGGPLAPLDGAGHEPEGYGGPPGDDGSDEEA